MTNAGSSMRRDQGMNGSVILQAYMITNMQY